MSLQVAAEDMNLNINKNIVRSYGVYFNLDEFDHPYQLKKKTNRKSTNLQNFIGSYIQICITFYSLTFTYN